MREIRIRIVNAFSDGKVGGSPAGVIFHADSLRNEEMINIASELGCPETAFILTSNKADYKIKFFSCIQEIDFCGHATIAAFHSLVKAEKIYFGNADRATVMHETAIGILPVECFRDGFIVMTQKKPKFYPEEEDRILISNLLGIDIGDLLDHPIQTVSTGVPKLIIPVKSLSVLHKIKPDLEGIKNYCLKNAIRGFYPFTLMTDDDSDFHARQFNPLSGIDEDPVTGIAAGALGAYIAKHKLSEKTSFIIEQGHMMNKKGRIYVDVTDAIKVGGYAFIVEERVINR